LAESNLMLAFRQREQEQLQGELEEGQLLAAALVAVLVEYKRHVRQSDEESSPDTWANWRVMSRWEQLRGRP
jgi:hypothetical protein